MEANKAITARQYFTSLPKHCLANRLVALLITNFFLLCLVAVFALLWFVERQERQQVQCIYQSTVELDSVRAQERHLYRLERLGLPIENKIAKEP